jgi:Disulphide bond corrector protein DsbC
MRRIGFAVLLLLGIGSFGSVQGQTPDFDEVLKKIEATFEPGSARPGETITLKIRVQLRDGWHTYPTEQPEKGAKSQTNKLTVPEPGAIIFVDKTVDPADPKSKAEPVLGVDELYYYPGGGVFERKAVVSPKAKPGDATVEVKFRVLVCDKNNCLPPKNFLLKANVKVADAPAVPVEAKYADEVKKALDGR